MIRVVREGGIAIVSFDRPELRNALTPEIFVALHRELDALGEPGEAFQGLVLAGEGKVFCGGFDLRLCLLAPGTLAALLKALHQTIGRLQALDIPVVVAAHGAAIAGGCALLGAADVVVTNADAKLGYPVTPLGVSPAISAPTLSDAIGEGRTRARQLDPALVSGTEAICIGLAHECVPTPDEVRPRAIAVARGLASKPRHAFAATKRWLREFRGPDRTAEALGASLSIVGGSEERERLAALFAATPR